FVPSGFFALRTPLLPFDELLAWGEGLQAASAGDDRPQLEATLAADRVCLRERLRRIYARPEVREALFVASPDLEERLEVWLRDPAGEDGKRRGGAVVRCSGGRAGRGTPCGLFPGASGGRRGDQGGLARAARTDSRRHPRLDMDYLVGLTDALARQPDLRGAL